MSRDPAQIFFDMIAFLFAITLHEAAHAWTAARCGDPTAKNLGRITLNPIKHIDLFGTIIIPVIGLLSNFGFIGWAKPTPVDPRNFKKPMGDDILVSVAGPASNLLLIVVFGSALKSAAIFSNFHQIPSTAAPLLYLCFSSVLINIVLFVFNLLPIPPLDGSHVIRHFLRGKTLEMYDNIGMYGLMLFFIANWYFDFLGVLIRPIEALVARVFLT
jgi:Zn-dependent protease